tara:strand:+ start:716 stop:871 length:156 start_codon:yes stop_codon:yes gene_type:complete
VLIKKIKDSTLKRLKIDWSVSYSFILSLFNSSVPFLGKLLFLGGSKIVNKD